MKHEETLSIHHVMSDISETQAFECLSSKAKHVNTLIYLCFLYIITRKT